MLFGKYVNKYYAKYAILFIIGIAALIAVDFIQTLIPEYLGEVVDILQSGGDPNRIFCPWWLRHCCSRRDVPWPFLMAYYII